MKGMKAMYAITDIDDSYIQNAWLGDRIKLRTAFAEPPHKRHLSLSSGWLVAAICLVVGIGVYAGLLGLGRGWFGPGVDPAGTNPDTFASETDDITDNTIHDTQGETNPPENASQGLLFSLVNDGYAVVGMGECTDTTLIIPAVYEGKPVVAIGKDAFNGRSEIREVYLPDSVRRIGDGAFSGCQGLTTIRLPEQDGVSIGKYAFYRCVALTGIYLHDGTTCDAYAFAYATSLTSLRLPEDMTYIPDGLCQECTALSEVNFPHGLLGIAHRAFEACASLTTVTLPDSLRSIDAAAFVGIAAPPDSIRIPESVTYLGLGCFEVIGGVPTFSVAQGDIARLEDGSPLGTYECYVDHCLVYVFTSESSYTIREGTRIIADSAFHFYTDQDVATVYMPETLPDYLSYGWSSNIGGAFVQIQGDTINVPITVPYTP